MKRSTALIALLSVALLAAACGAPAPTASPTPPGNTPPATSTPAPSPTPSPSPSPTPAGVPGWLNDLIAKLESEPAANPPLGVTEYLYKGQTVYFVPQRCCDIFSDLYAVDGTLIAHPDGGIAGHGDGRAPDFFETRTLVRVIWVDGRGPEGRRLVVAPIEAVSITPGTLRSGPSARGGHTLWVRSGLPDACHEFAGYEFDTQRFMHDNVIEVRVRNTAPAEGAQIACAEVYRTVDTAIPLPFDLQPGVTYTIDVNGKTVQYTPSPGTGAEDQEKLNAARARWDQANLSEYTMRFQWSCFCVTSMVGPVIVTVEDGKVVSVVRDDNQPEAEPDIQYFKTVDELFAMLQDAIDEPVGELRVAYHEALGYPTNAYIDYLKMAIDDEKAFTLEVIVP